MVEVETRRVHLCSRASSATLRRPGKDEARARFALGLRVGAVKAMAAITSRPVRAEDGSGLNAPNPDDVPGWNGGRDARPLGLTDRRGTRR